MSCTKKSGRGLTLQAVASNSTVSLCISENVETPQVRSIWG